MPHGVWCLTSSHSKLEKLCEVARILTACFAPRTCGKATASSSFGSEYHRSSSAPPKAISLHRDRQLLHLSFTGCLLILTGDSPSSQSAFSSPCTRLPYPFLSLCMISLSPHTRLSLSQAFPFTPMTSTRPRPAFRRMSTGVSKSTQHSRSMEGSRENTKAIRVHLNYCK